MSKRETAYLETWALKWRVPSRFPPLFVSDVALEEPERWDLFDWASEVVRVSVADRSEDGFGRECSELFMVSLAMEGACPGVDGAVGHFILMGRKGFCSAAVCRWEWNGVDWIWWDGNVCNGIRLSARGAADLVKRWCGAL